jgi:hypothetical protein
MIGQFKNIWLVLKDQMPLGRLFRNFFITRNAWGLFHQNSHISQGTGKLKVKYNTKATAVKSADAMKRKYGHHFNAYKCLRCDGYHIGKSKQVINTKTADKPS